MRPLVAFVFGTRPEAIKMAPVVRSLRTDARFAVRVIVTAQHRGLLDQVLRLFDIEPDVDLDLMRPNQSLAALTARVVESVSEVLSKLKPSLVFVQGDTTTTFAGALAAFYHQQPVAHLEAGLRSHDRLQPFPEEINRVITTRLASLHFAPTKGAKNNLIREGVPASGIHVVGNTGIDALLSVASREDMPLSPAAADVATVQGRLLFVTAHRRENHGEKMKSIATIIRRVVDEHHDVSVALPVHPNPNVSQVLAPLSRHPRIHILDSLDYYSCVQLMKRCSVVLTDSGGIQEEAPALGKPVLVMRDKTERPEGLAYGVSRLVGTDPDVVRAALNEVLCSTAVYNRMAHAVNPYGDGRASERIAAVLERELLGRSDARIEEFQP